ncbi:Uncharacterised protein [Legionella beliardensis]|uniref:Uncharacterized protein n=1 Tax=Legionella beliardensis TaxID=91822 RepID=A0A378I149_9GAMM|nr:hypothetical protein [Legionella beliardensis]STX28450.1 Uncharacterised protein [Legionella beliardensis]
MESIIQLDNIYYRSKKRIKELGEVFTPDSYTEAMLSLLAHDKNFSWANENTVFFEPCCGHGNIVLVIFSKRLEAFFYNSKRYSKNYSAFYAVANAINTLWAIDIDSQNIADCRSRLFRKSLDFLKNKLKISDYEKLINRDKNFFAHLLCSIYWHIHENEMLSAVEKNKKHSKLNAQKTKASAGWLNKNKIRPLNFQLTWTAYFVQQIAKNSTPILFKKAMKFIEDINSNYGTKNKAFDFAKNLYGVKQNREMDLEGRCNQILH